MARVLIIDDDERLLGALSQALRRAGHEVLTASRGVAGVELFRASPTDVVITDIIMPDKEGMEIICELHQDFPDLPIIAMSGGSPKGFGTYLPSAEALGACRTLEKPFRLKVLIDAVADVLSGGAAAPSSR